MTGKNTHLESDGRAIQVTLSYNTDAKAVAWVEGWLGITGQSGASGETVSLSIDRREYQFTVPASLTVNKGDVVYITVSAVTGTHMPPDSAYSTTAGSGKIALFKATSDKNTTNHSVTGILLPNGGI